MKIKETINGDIVKNKKEKFYYFKQCLENHKIGLDKGAKVLEPILSYNKNLIMNGSPARILSNIFWNSLDFSQVHEELREKINFLEIGCGSGRYGTLIEKLSKKYFGSYTGLDIYLDNNFPEKFYHLKIDAEKINLETLKDINFIFSQSSLEHIKNDSEVLFNTTKILSESKKKFISIHLIPAKSSLFLYAWHGWRQYSLRNINKIACDLMRLSNVSVYAIPLGGPESFKAHIKYTFANKIFAKFPIFNTQVYRSKLSHHIVKCVTRELKCCNKNPIFWILIISNFEQGNYLKLKPPQPICYN